MTSLIAEVIDRIESRGSATVDDLMPEFPARTRQQVMTALQQASYERRIQCDGQQHTRAGSAPAVYRANPRPRIASVWDLAQNAEKQAA